MIQDYRELRDKADILQTCDEVLSLESLLDEYIAEIEKLRRGHVLPSETKRRSKTGAYVSEVLQQVTNFLEKNKLVLKYPLSFHIKRVRDKAERVLRENIVLQTTPPLDVIKFKDVPVRYVYSSFGGREQRWGYGLHKKPLNEDGESITVAKMPPHYVQTIHNHTVSEYCLIIGSKTEGIYYPGKKNERIYSTRNSEIFHFSATTPHTLRNSSNKPVRNLTFKHPSALFDWKSSSHLNLIKVVRARIIKGELTIFNKKITKKFYQIHDRFYNYQIVVTKLEEGAVIEGKFSKDHYIFVVKGKLEVSHENIHKQCRRNDFIVIDKNTPYTLSAKSLSRIYEVSYPHLT